MAIFADGMTKTLYIIAGCNGAGKTTASMLILPGILDCQEFVNADEIANYDTPRTVIADGSINGTLNVYSEELFLKLKSYVRRREE